ncbi:MAG TPA: apolipoprotein N-acyltransferase [Pseudomonadales bacterium]|nr:apolipoprotein N-acyltransferase [Pseudomonadales bacterium]
MPLALAPFELWPLAVVAPGLLFLALWRQAPRRALLLGWLTGVTRYGVGVSWIYVSIHEHGNASPLLAGTMVALFVMAMALLPALMALAFAGLRARGAVTAVLAFTACWVLLEWLLTWLLTGFPWLFAGAAQVSTPLGGWAPVAGVLGVSLVTVFIGATLAAFALPAEPATGRRGVAALAVLAALLWIGGTLLRTQSFTTPAGPPLRVALVQGVIPQEIKWLRSSRAEVTERYETLSEPFWGADLLLWPEAALTVFAREAPELLERLDARGRASGTTLVLGMPDYERVAPGSDRAVFLNTALAVGDGAGRYVKQRLVPFGEYVPLEGVLRGLIEFFDLPMARARSGAPGQAPLRIGGRHAAVAICYEIAYPDLVRELADGTELLLTISNDTWFGASIGPDQHLQIARMRALELGKPLARATNDGITALVDARGGLGDRLPRFQPGVLTGSIQPMAGRTPFAVTGSWPTVLLAFLLLLPALLPAQLTGPLRDLIARRR